MPDGAPATASSAVELRGFERTVRLIEVLVVGFGAALLVGSGVLIQQTTLPPLLVLAVDMPVFAGVWLAVRACEDVRDRQRALASAALAAAERTTADERRRDAEQLEAIGRLAGGVAHDVNNALTTISGYSQIVLEALPADDPIRADVREIRLGADRVAAITSQLLAFSRRQILQPDVLDLSAVLDALEPSLRRMLPESIELVVHPDRAAGRVRFDRRQLDQVFETLALHARSAMPSGGRLTIRTAQLPSASDAASGGVQPDPAAAVAISVTDTGSGIAEEARRHLFEPFYETSEAATGRSLGLATLYGTVAQSGGSIEVSSEAGRGTTFRIVLPCVDAPATAIVEPVGPGASPAHPTGAGTILLVEDDAALRSLVRTVLTRAGYRAVVASDGAAGLALARGHLAEIDLLLTDVVMPVMGGPALADAVHQLRPDLPVLFMSGYPEHAVDDQGAIDPSWEFIAKPFAPSSLLERIAALLDDVRA